MIEESTINTEINFSVQIFWGLLRAYQAGYAYLYKLVDDQKADGQSILNSAVFGSLFLFWCGTLGKNKTYNHFWLYFDLILSLGY